MRRQRLVAGVISLGVAAGLGLVVTSSWEEAPIKSDALPTITTPSEEPRRTAAKGSGTPGTALPAAATPGLDTVAPSTVDWSTTQTTDTVAGHGSRTPAQAGTTTASAPSATVSEAPEIIQEQLPEEIIGSYRCPEPTHVILWDGTCGIPDPSSHDDEKDELPYVEEPEVINCPEGRTGYLNPDGTANCSIPPTEEVSP